MAGGSAGEMARRQRVKDERLLQSSERWARGAEDARATAAVLDELPSEQWRVLHDVPWPGRPRASIDHIVIGPAGVFVVDTKNWSGAISVRAGVLRQGRYSREGAVAAAEEAARAVARVLRLPASRVEPVLCLVREDKLVAATRDVTVCSTGSIVQTLTSRPRTLSELHVRSLAVELEPYRVRFAVTATRPPTSRSRRSTRPRRRGAPKRTGALVGALAALTVAATLASNPEVVTDLAEGVSRFLGDRTD